MRKPTPITADALVDTVAWEFNLPRGYLMGRHRHDSVAFARQALYFLLRTHLNWSWQRIATFCGRSDYHTIRFGVFRIMGDHRYDLRRADMNASANPRYARKLGKAPYFAPLTTTTAMVE